VTSFHNNEAPLAIASDIYKYGLFIYLLWL